MSAINQGAVTEHGRVKHRSRAPRFLAFDALRGLAAMMVMAHHVEQGSSTGIFQHCYLAVDFFFMLSGFVLSFAYDERLTNGLGVEHFMKARLLRLWPTIALGIVLGAVSMMIQGEHLVLVIALIAMQLCFVPLLSAPGAVFPLDGVQWSLLVELAANAAHGVALYRWSNRFLAIIVALGAIALFGIAYGHGKIGVGDFSHNWAWGFVRIVFPYSAGMLLFRLWRRGWHMGHAVPWGVSIIALPMLLLLAALPALRGNWLLDPLIVTLVLPVILWLAADAELPRIWHSAAAIGGILSYPLYAVHVPVMVIVWLATGRDTTAITRLLEMSAAIALSWCWARWIEDLRQNRCLPATSPPRLAL